MWRLIVTSPLRHQPLVCVSTRGVSTQASSSSALFDRCFLLNLDKRVDKLQHTMRQVKKSKLERFIASGKVERVSGVDGLTLSIDDLVTKGLVSEMGRQRFLLPREQKLFGMDLTPGAVGCALGHRSIWQRVVDEKIEKALILEDDVEFHPRFSRMLPELWERVPTDWGIVYFGGLDLLSKGKSPRPFLHDGVRLAYHGHRELTAYVVNAASAKRCLELSVPMTWQVDTHICNQLAHDPVANDDFIADPRSYVFQPALAIQVTSFGTDVQKQTAENSQMEDASRRLREFVQGGTSVR